MKQTLSLLFTFLFTGGFLFAQVPGIMTMQPASAPQGTDLGANTTSSAAGIALGNRVKLRGFADFIFSHRDDDSKFSGPVGNNQGDETDFSTAADVDFLIDFSPVTAEVHLAATAGGSVTMEQAFGRYSVNRDFSISFGRLLGSLGFEADEAPGLYATSQAYHLGSGIHGSQGLYMDGLRANFNNGRFGFIAGLYDSYWASGSNFDGGVALDLAASMMIVPGLEARLGFAHEEVEATGNDISQFNAFVSYNPGALTLALEYDNFNIQGADMWDIMLLANYQFIDWMGGTFRYTHEDAETSDADRFTFALLFTITDNLFFNVEYSHTDVDGMTYSDYDELYLEGLITF
jgi:hypothetical protein